MNGEAYDDVMEMDETYPDVDEDIDNYGPSEVDEMLDGLVESDENFAERRRRRARRGRGKPVPTAPGRNAYRSPATEGFVTQKQLKDALTRVGVDIKRNAVGIKTINTRLTGVNTRVDDVVTVSKVQSGKIGRLDRQMKVDGALELVQSFNAGGLDAFQLLKGAVKSGFLGESKGALGNPLVIGGIGLVLRNPNILGGILPPAVPSGRRTEEVVS